MCTLTIDYETLELREVTTRIYKKLKIISVQRSGKVDARFWKANKLAKKFITSSLVDENLKHFRISFI